MIESDLIFCCRKNACKEKKKVIFLNFYALLEIFNCYQVTQNSHRAPKST